MKKFILKLLIFMTVLYWISYMIYSFTEFQLVNIVFVTGVVSCFFTYGGRVSSLGEGVATTGTVGGYVPSTKVNKFTGAISPYFLGAILTALSSFVLMMFM
ncbi:hypothetical protein ACTWQB_09085 [Piscibacillus sp. B03]|uniref:hypothetical protein n=1 Tax=Piscibacillus sp. B03 TaxID=3457430 RepID=UPI003FCDA203